MALGNGSYFPADTRRAWRPAVGRELGTLSGEIGQFVRSNHDLPAPQRFVGIEAERTIQAAFFSAAEREFQPQFARSADLAHGGFPYRVHVGAERSVWVSPAEGALPAGRLTGPVQFLKRLMDAWELKESEVGTLLGFEDNDLSQVRSILSGYSSLRGRDVKDRVRILLDLRKSLYALFRDDRVERDWLNERQVELGGKSPREYVLEGSMISLLKLKDFVDEMCGR